MNIRNRFAFRELDRYGDLTVVVVDDVVVVVVVVVVVADAVGTCVSAAAAHWSSTRRPCGLGGVVE